MAYLGIALAIIAGMSFAAFMVYWLDKRRAVQGKWRIPEITLLTLSFFGGAIGGYIAMYSCHHKTRKWYFHLVNILGLVVTAAVIVLSLVYGEVINI